MVSKCAQEMGGTFDEWRNRKIVPIGILYFDATYIKVRGSGIFTPAMKSIAPHSKWRERLPLFCQAIRRLVVNELKEKVLGFSANGRLQLPTEGLVSKDREGNVQENGEEVNTENGENTSFLITLREDERGFGSAVFGTYTAEGKNVH